MLRMQRSPSPEDPIMLYANHLLALEKAVHSGNISAIVPEDLEIEAHNTLWNETDSGELTLLKLCPSTPATSIVHQYTRITSFGDPKGSGLFSERSLPPETNFESERVANHIKLMGEIGSTYLLAHLQETQQALGTSGAVNIERVALRKSVLWKKNRNLYFCDTRSVRQGIAGARFKGLYQLIDEGTDGTTGESPYGSHIFDMRGEPLTIETIRQKVARSLTLFGRFSTLLTDPFVRGNLESSLDSVTRLNLPISAKPYVVGQHIGGLQTQGGTTFFETDNSLTPIWSRGQYSASISTGMPITTPTVTATVAAPASGQTSEWDAGSAGNVYYVITETSDEREGLGTRVPATPATYLSIAAGQRISFSITAGSPLADSFKVYRGTDADVADPTDAWFIYEIANTGGAVAWSDLNNDRPNTSMAFGLNIHSDSQRQMAGGMVEKYDNARSNSADFLKQKDLPRNVVAVAELGPSMGTMALASTLATVDRPLIYSACCPEVRNPRQCVVFKNIGTI